MKAKQSIYRIALSAVLLVTNALGTWSYSSFWNYSTTAKDEGRESDGGNYVFRYDLEATKKDIMCFKTYYRFDVNNNQFLWNFDLKVNYGTVDNNNTTHVSVTIEYADGYRMLIAEASFVGYLAPTVTTYNRPVYISRIKSSGDFKYMFTLEYQPTAYDLEEGVKRIYIEGVTKWGNNVRNFQYERDLDISSYTNMAPSYNCELDNEGNYLFNVTGDKAINKYNHYREKYFTAHTTYGISNLGTDEITFTLDDEHRSGGTDENADYQFRVPVRSYTQPLRIYNVDYTIDAKRHTQSNRNTDHYAYTVKSASGDAYREGILFKPYTRVDNLNVSFDQWTKQNVIQWTRIKQVKDWISPRYIDVDCQTEGTWYVIRYEKGEEPTSYIVIGQIGGNSTNLKVTDDKIDYDKEYIYRVVFLPKLLQENYKDRLTSLPGESDSHTQYDLWEETSVNTKLDVPITLTQDRSDNTGIRLIWDYNVQTSGLDWRIDRRPTGETTWTQLTTLPVDTRQSSASYLTEGTVCDFNDYRLMIVLNGREVYSNILTANLPAGSYISQVRATAGTEENNVIVKWNIARADAFNDISYRVLRRQIGTDEWTLLTDEIHGTASEYTYIDNRVMAGSYYEYTVEAYDAKCDEQLVRTDSKIVPGFSQARGTITGHVAYGTGTAVAGVQVNLVKSSSDESTDTPQYLSRYIDGLGKGLTWKADSTKYANVLSGSKALTLQLWARPVVDDTSYQTLLELANTLELGFINSGSGWHLYAVDKSTGSDATEKREMDELPIDVYDFNHITAAYAKGEWTFYVGNDTLLSARMSVANPAWNCCSADADDNVPATTLSFGCMTGELQAAFKGYVDDVRLWNRALSAKEVAANYTRILGGTENGLILYWPMDEGLNVEKYIFDVACQDGIWQQNHPEVGVNARPSATVPQQLRLYGLTDAEGDYIIRGIPFQQGGTNYKVVPQLGIHEFNPNSSSMFISPTSLTANSVNFEDVSSFPMEGYIYYAGTNIPAEGIKFYVDGELLTGNGEFKTTDANGYYKISVPIGNHYVEAKLEGHTMVDGGRFPTQGTYNFNRALTHDFTDSTLVNFVGRVSGGLRNDTIAVGFGASVNNIGTATVQLKLNNESFSFNCQDDHISDATTQRTWDSDTTSINSTAWTGTGYDARYIYIHTDPQTGEFSALLPPLKYITKSIKVDTNEDIEIYDLPEIDLTSVQKEMKDSMFISSEGGGTTLARYYYNTKMVRTFFAEPQVEVVQRGGKGAFGEQELKNYRVSNTETTNITDIWTRKGDGSVNYTYDFPVFGRNTEYFFDIYAYEVYINHDNGTVIADTIPLNGQVLTIQNEMSNAQTVVARVIDPSLTDLKEGEIYDLKLNQIRLDTDGRNELSFTTGLPNITAPYTRHFGITYERNGRFYNGFEMNAIVLGELTNGNNFVTEGPEVVSMVLRDPPGAKSKTTWKTGTIKTKIENRTSGGYENETVQAELIWGADLRTATGVGVMLVSTKEAVSVDNVGEHGTLEILTKKENTWVYTTGENIATSTGSKYVGAAGDVFIGTSHNLIVGTCRKLGFHREAEGIVLGLKEAISLSDSIRTDFAYAAYDIENTMIPKLIDTRNAMLEYKDSLSAAGFVNDTEQDVYLTWLTPDDPRYGQDSTYVWKQGIHGKSQDMVLKYNQAVERWREALRTNEKDKIMAFEDAATYYKENRSFDGGTSYSYSERHDTTHVVKDVESISLGFVFNTKTRIGISAGAYFGANFEMKTETGYKRTTETADYDDNIKTYAEIAYDLTDGNPGTDFTVDIYHSPSGWGDIFLLRGGQSYNPYEAEEKTKYYETEKGYTISYGTERMEQPIIAISTDGSVGAKSATLTDVSAGQMGQFTLHLTNGTTTNQDVPFIYNLQVMDYTNTHGLEILMDGVPANGRSIYIPAGETIKKVITVRQTDQSVLDYEGIELWLSSQYQPAKIKDIANLSVHFKPSSSPISLAVTEPVMNIETLELNKGNLELKVSNFNRQFRGMKEIGVQYRYEGSTTWVTPFTYLVDKADSTHVTDKILPEAGDLQLTLNMKANTTYPEGNYTFRAYTMTKYGQENVYVYSDEVKVVKDMTRPRQLVTPTPASGILGVGDDISIEFNEDIVPGYVDAKNVIVSAKLNDQPINHETALMLMPYGVAAKTENPVFLSGDFSMEMWLKYTQGGVVIRQGNSFGRMALKITNTGQVAVSLGGNDFVSTEQLPRDTWIFFVLSFKASDMTFSMLGEYETTSVLLFDKEPVTFSAVDAINYVDDNHLYLGSGITGTIHDLALYNIYRDVNDAASKKYVSKDNYTYGLTNYWPMNEGHGTVAADMRHTHDFIVNNRWEIAGVNFALKLDEAEGATADISRINTSVGDSYAIELWTLAFKKACTLFETGSVAENKLCLRYDEDMNLWLDYGERSQMVASAEDFPNSYSWHHLALNVVRGQAASFYYDGQRTAVIAERDVPMMEGQQMTIGEGLNGNIDELRIWRAALTENRLLANRYNCIDTADVYSRGLVAYYPFEKEGVVNGVATKVATLENMAPSSLPTTLTLNNPSENVWASSTPPLKSAPRENTLIASPVASDRKVVVNLSGAGISPRDIEGATLNITVDKVFDMHGNQSTPIRWTAYVQQNTLKWTRDSVNINKRYGTDYTFDVSIENKGGSTEYYSLRNLPSWLTPIGSEMSDNLGPLSQKTLRFKVNPLVAVGNYDVTIGLQGNSEIMEPLRIVMKVQGQMPEWTVDPTQYEHRMNVIGQIYINGTLMENADSRVAAFINDECRGIAAPEAVRSAAYVTMTIYGNGYDDEDAGAPISFRIWDATKGVAYTDANVVDTDGSQMNISFQIDQIVGNFDAPVILTKGDNLEQTLLLNPNWNWIALGVVPADNRPEIVFPDLTTWKTVIKDQYSSVYSNGSLWKGNLTIEAAKMYKMHLTKGEGSNDISAGLSVKGRQVNLGENPVTLKKEWNWIAYTPMTSMTLDEALAGANPQRGDYVKSQTGLAIYNYNGWEGNLKALESGHGYMYYNSSGVVKQFAYPEKTTTSSSMHAPIIAVRRAPLHMFEPVDPTTYPDNMTMVIRLVDGQEPVDSAEVAAFIDDECRGATRADDGLYYLIIAGDGSGQALDIRTCINGEILTIDRNLTYTSDSNIGTPWEPYVIDIKNATSIEGILYGGLANDKSFDLQGRRLLGTPKEKGVYIVNGRKVVVK
jgi:hypothetical protein